MIFKKTRGQKRAAARLQGLLSTGRIPSALLFHGLEGVGKTLMAHEFAQALLCRGREGDAPACGLCSDCQAVERRLHPDVKAVNASYQASLREEEAAKQRSLRVETIRHLRGDMELHSLLGGWKVAVIEEAHTLEIEAANALLKILEEPPPRTLWILVAAQRDRLPKTVLSRCFSVPFAPLAQKDVAALLADRGVDPTQAERLARLSEGSVSRALELAEQPLEALSAEALGPFVAADSLPRELFLARQKTELALFALAQDLRSRHLSGELAFSSVEPALRELTRLRQALRANADPRAILTLAGLEAQGFARP
jgi:DNA polymerase-3 subunit delta'